MLKNLNLEPHDIKVDKDIEFVYKGLSDNDESFSGVTAYLEVWFDVDKKFGLNICNFETDEYINLYANVHMPEKRVEVFYIMQHGPNDQKVFYPEMTDKDKALILKEVDWMHKTTYGTTIDKAWVEFIAETNQPGA